MRNAMHTEEERVIEKKAIARYEREGRRRATKRKVKNIAGLGLCMELYKLSGWNDTYFGWTSTNIQSAWVDTLPEDFTELVYPLITPAYDLGYLLRKLPGRVNRYPFRLGRAVDKSYWAASYDNQHILSANTPEDAACKLVIELFKEGILKRE
jgi:hypothetical protein